MTNALRCNAFSTGIVRRVSRAAALPGRLIASLVLLLGAGSAALAQPVTSYTDAVISALSVNPAVTSAYYEFEAVRESEAVARGALLPSVDVSGDYAWEDRQTPIQDFGDYERDALRFSISQLLFDGFQTRDEMRARRYEKLARYYDFHRASQEVALDATSAYVNTVLYQQLVSYAEENYVVHRQVLNKIAERADAGISQGVDLEQASARMALAESNLLTEVTNLHDTRAEFQRVVGRLPADDLPSAGLPSGAMPLSREDALQVAYLNSPQVNSSVEELRSAREAMNATRGPMYPRLDLRYRNETESNTDGILGDYDFEAVEVVLNYNLYRGGSDSARRREFANRYYFAIESRKEACLTVRRETVIAFNDADVLERQVQYLTQQLDSQDKTRRAYNDQFDLGQRSLLDLLDSQNEYFDTQRALSTAKAQLIAAQARTLSNIGALTGALDVEGFNADKLAELELDLSRGDDEEIPLCPDGAPSALNIDQEAIFERLNREADTDGGFAVATPSPAPSSASSASSGGGWTLDVPEIGGDYVVQEGDTLWSIAAQAMPAGASLEQTMEAIGRMNPRAFKGGNVDNIMAGFKIKLPTAGDILP